MSRNSGAGFKPVPQNEGAADVEKSVPPPKEEWYSLTKRDGRPNWPMIIIAIIAILLLVALVGLIIYFIVVGMGTISFDKSLATQYVSPGMQNFRIKCSATTSSENLMIKLAWKIDDSDAENFSSEVWMDEDDGSLIIMRPNQQRDEKRDYTCVARGMENGEVKEESKMIIKIRIKRAPRFINTENRVRKLTLNYGEKATITCEVDAQPPAIWRWKCGGVEINDDNPNKDKFKVKNYEENKSKLELDFYPELFQQGSGCNCYPQNEVSTNIITLGTNLTVYYPPVKLHPARVDGQVARLSTYRDESKGRADTRVCFFVQYRKMGDSDAFAQYPKLADSEDEKHDNDVADWKFAERILTSMDFDVRRCSIERWTDTYLDGFYSRDVFQHLHVVGSAHFDLHGLQPSSKYEVRAMALTEEDDGVPKIRFSDKIEFRTKEGLGFSSDN